MDAMPMSTQHLFRTPPPPPWPQRLAAWGVVLAVHVLIGAWLMHTTRTAGPPADPHRISLRWLTPPPQLVEAPALPSTALSTPASRPRTTVSLRQPAADRPMDTLVETAQTPATPLDLGLRSGAVSGGDGIEAALLAPKLIGRRDVHAAFQDRPRYFRMRPQMSPQQVLQGIAQYLGLWPPGYTVDPCTLGRQDMQYFHDAVDDQDRQALRDAIHQASARCP